MTRLRLTGPAIDAIAPYNQDLLLHVSGGRVLVTGADLGDTCVVDDHPAREAILAELAETLHRAACAYVKGSAARAAMGTGPWPLEDVCWDDLAGAAWIPDAGYDSTAQAVDYCIDGRRGHIDTTEGIDDPVRAVIDAAALAAAAGHLRRLADAEIAAR